MLIMSSRFTVKSYCPIMMSNGTCGTDVRVRNHKLHCHNCYSNDEGLYR
uniref:Uncharacterized protein n=1 Tax=Tetranychus urticae TaxID=32264 RepID=T1L1L8_TETUR